MSKKTNIIKRQSPELWKWAGTTITSLICSETLVDEYINTQKQKIERIYWTYMFSNGMIRFLV